MGAEPDRLSYRQSVTAFGDHVVAVAFFVTVGGAESLGSGDDFRRASCACRIGCMDSWTQRYAGSVVLHRFGAGLPGFVTDGHFGTTYMGVAVVGAWDVEQIGNRYHALDVVNLVLVATGLECCACQYYQGVTVVLVVVYIAVGDLSYYRGNEVISFDYSFIERVLIVDCALWFYVGKLLLLIDLAVVYPFWDIDIADPLGWVCLLSTILVAALLWYFRNQIGRRPLACTLFFLVTLSPILGFVNYGYMHANHYQYLAGVGVIATLVGVTTHYLRNLSGKHDG